MKKILLAVAALAAFAPRPIAAQTFLPPNEMRIPIGSAQDKGITQPQFDAVLDRIQAIYGPIIAAKGGELVINRNWEDDTVNAYAERQGNQYIISMFGGLARHQVVTQDGFAMVACHEIGHHLGGAPKIRGEWATNEGGADYFAPTKCLRRVFADKEAARFTRMQGQNDVAKTACAASFPNSDADQKNCVRSTMAGISLSILLAGGGKSPDLSTPDPKVVSRTDDSHPAAQCRLDTYFQASLCTRSYKEDLSDSDPAAGSCTKAQGFKTGLRPRCWYKPSPNEVSPGLASRLEATIAPNVLSGF